MFFSPRTFATPVSTWTKNVFFRGLLPPQNEKPALPLSPGQCRFCILHTKLASKDTIKHPLCLFDRILSRFIMPPCCFAWCQASGKTTLFLNKTCCHPAIFKKNQAQTAGEIFCKTRFNIITTTISGLNRAIHTPNDYRESSAR
ncbi:hypothetical protein THS27_03040 [Thalassospira sp. MCCC 1A01428]|nr:hypothetical protein THS27_03040 [Thalassospira sp. MCCC 1A01428]